MQKKVKSFVDTNVVVYARDLSYPDKMNRARELLSDLAGAGTGVVSSQVLWEFASVALSKFKLAHPQVKEMIRSLEDWECVCPDPKMIQAAVDCVHEEHISIWDAMLVVAAERARCDILYTEDLNHGQHIRGIQIINPFV